MKEQIESKIQEIVEYIIRKPVEEVTLDEYTVLVNERQEIQNKENQADNSKRMAAVYPGQRRCGQLFRVHGL